ncbi:hypothetical protein VNI00_010761 [Paramarasmius palmivorus]|uniref:Uncharacterized protein n=1 Tax=Paramarasmius palmivorus TaxID=297713 RepID=A0AAW0CF16_9AGAR
MARLAKHRGWEDDQTATVYANGRREREKVDALERTMWDREELVKRKRIANRKLIGLVKQATTKRVHGKRYLLASISPSKTAQPFLAYPRDVDGPPQPKAPSRTLPFTTSLLYTAQNPMFTIARN